MKKHILLTLSFLILISCSKEGNNITSFISNGGNYPSISEMEKPNYHAKELNKVSKTQSFNEKVDEDYLNSLRSFTNDFTKVTLSNSDYIFSPLSIYNCYAMLYEGMSGELKSQMANTLHYHEVSSLKESVRKVSQIAFFNEKDSKLDTSSSFWIDDDYANFIRKEYLDTLSSYYYAEAFQGQLESKGVCQDMADWVNYKTNDLFHLTEDSFQTSPFTILVLINTIYLKDCWVNEFSKNLNEENIFHTINQKDKKVTFMKNRENNYVYHGDDFDISSLSFAKGVKMNLLLPHEDVDSLSTIQNHILDVLSPDSLQKHLYDVTYIVPQFQIKNKFDLTNELPKMGVQAPFEPSAQYENMIQNTNPDDPLKLYVSQSIHEAGIEINNDGVEAAAYTSIIGNVEAAMPDPDRLPTFLFELNRPFSYSLTYQGIPLFVGTYMGKE